MKIDARQERTDNARGHGPDLFRMSEFDAVAEARSVADLLRDNLESAAAQLRVEQRRARRAERRAQDLVRAVETWHDLLDDYERTTHSSANDRRN